MADPGLVLYGTADDNNDTNNYAQGLPNTPANAAGKTPSENTASGGVDVIRDTLRCSGFPEHITNIILQSWRTFPI